jgi:Uma2 family endonuclease
MQGIVLKYLPHYTVEDYLKWEGDWELIEGVPYALAPSPVAKHQMVSGLIYRYIAEQLENCGKDCHVFFELDWVINEDTVVRPDVTVVCGKVEDFIRKTPEVIFEVISPLTARKDEYLKFYLYEKERVPYYVMVYPEIKKVKIFKFKEDKYQKVFEGKGSLIKFESVCPFEVDFNWIWQRV